MSNKVNGKDDRKDLLIDDMYPPEEVELTSEEEEKIEKELKKLGII
jgi:hypothetical protein